MGTHKGWTLRKVARGWKGMVLIRGTGTYRSKTFPERVDAVAWAQVEAAGVLTGHLPNFREQAIPTVDAVTDYLAELTSLGRSPRTITDLQSILGAFAGAFPRLDLATVRDVEKWLLNLRSSGRGRGGKDSDMGPARKNKVLVNVRSFCRWCQRRRGLRQDPTADLRLRQVDQTLKPQFSVTECRALLSGRDSQTRRWVALMILAGLRSDEARCLRWCDLDQPGGILLVRLGSGANVKRRKERIVPLQPGLMDCLGEPGKPGSRICSLGTGNLSRAWEDYLTARRIIPDGRTPHSCRHTFAGLMTATGVPTALVGAYLGHSSAQTTMGYTALAARFAQDPEVKTWGRGVLDLTP